MFGMLLASLGTFGVAAGLARAAFIPDVGGVEGWMLATGVGFAFLVVGAIQVAFSLRADEVETGIVPATVAFNSRTAQPLPPSEPRRVARPAAKPASDPRGQALHRLDEEIRDVTRRINKAGVMLATGQLSDDGYAKYVDELKHERGQLEARRVKLELGQSM